ncbi:hypothetical protein evm_002624 [Chilo suppressalis]|nr:hypothetical protein evm_002624 [Chilo suppressalis]
MPVQYLLWAFTITTVAASTHVHNAVETEMFAIPISPNLFNWTYQEFDQQYRFHASLHGKPELPSWLRYIYSGRHHSGFIFGTPPRSTKSPITIEVIGLNRQDYETRRVLLSLFVKPKVNMARHEVELKIDNLNVEDLLDEHRMTRLKDILKTKLWVESSQDLYTTFLASAIDLGARLPLRPSDGEGLVVRLGSSAPLSKQLEWLREEVRPLARLPTCPRDYKRTTSERLFRDAGFTLDWCNFQLYNTIYRERSTEHVEYLTEIPNTSKAAHSVKSTWTHDVWSAPSRHSLPVRSYTRHLTAAVAVPLLLLLLSVAALTAVLCFHYASVRDSQSEYFLQNIFHICIDYRNRRAHKSNKVEICRYGTGNTDQTQVADNTSNKSIGVSPNNSLVRPSSPRRNLAASYNRPQPPPYARPASPARRLALHDSLKLLNDAELNPVLDYTDGADDYVPIDSEYVAMKGSPEIDVPDLAKVGALGLM